MKQILFLLLSLTTLAGYAQYPISSINITMPANPAANISYWGSAMPPVMITAQAQMRQGQVPGDVQESRILVTIKQGGSKKYGAFTQDNAPSAGFTTAVKTWSGAAATGLLGKDVELPPGSYELCVQFFSYNTPAKPLSNEVCKTFTVQGSKDEKYNPPVNIAPVDKKVFTEKEIKEPITFRWTPIVPRPQVAVVYKLKVWQIMQGQTASQAIQSSQPIIEEEVKDQTQFMYRKGWDYWPKAASAVWRIEATDGQGKILGVGEATIFSIQLTDFKPINICCTGSSWGAMEEVRGNGIKNVKMPSFNSSLGVFDCKSEKKYNICFNANKKCGTTPVTIKYEIFNSSNVLQSTVSSASCSNANVSFPNISGAYTLKISALVAGTICKQGVYNFEIRCRQENDSLDLTGCDLDIDTTIVNVSCNNSVNIQTTFDGVPNSILYTIYDSTGLVVYTISNTSNFTFTLPGSGVYYGVVEASCGGGDAGGGDEDEDVFEIVNTSPIAEFSLESSTFVNISGINQREISTIDNSMGESALLYSWTIQNISSGTTTNYTSDQPSYLLDYDKDYLVTLEVEDSKGCKGSSNYMLKSQEKCTADFKFSYSWCLKDNEECTLPKDVMVSFTNKSDIPNGAPVYSWNFGDGSPISNEMNPSHNFLSVPCAGQTFSVTLTITSGTLGDALYCEEQSNQLVTISSIKPVIGVESICCDGLVRFYTDAIDGEWSTPGSLGIPKWPAVNKKIGNLLGHRYRQYYSTPGPYSYAIIGAKSPYANLCAVQGTFTISSVECFNRNVRVKKTDVVDGITVKLKFTALALPLVHRMKSKIRTTGFKKVSEISTDFSGEINKKGADNCYCTPQSVSAASGTITNKRKAKAKTSTSGRFRIGLDKATANFYIKTKNGVTKTWKFPYATSGSTGDPLKLGRTPCDHPWFLFF